MLDKLRNLTWLSAEPLFRLVSGLVILLVVARQLGPAAFGTFAYAMALIAIFQAFARFGQEGAIMRRVALEPGSAPVIFGSSLVVSLLVAGVSTLACLAYLHFGWQSGEELAGAALYIALTVMVTPGEVAFGILKAREQVSRAVAWRLAIAILGLGGLVGLAFMQADAGKFVALRSLEIAAAALVVLVLAWQLVRREGALRVSMQRIKMMAADGLPLLVYGLMAIAMLRIDQLMIGPLAGGEELGRYSVAVRISEMGNFVAMALSSTLFAAAGRNLIEEDGGERYFQRYFDLFALVGLTMAGGLALFSWLFLVPVLGDQYAQALPMVLILLCGTPLFFANIAFELLRNLRGWLWSGVTLSVCALLANIAVNFWLIPVWGGVGAAIATVLSLAIVGLAGALVLRHTRRAGLGMLRAFNPVAAVYRLWMTYRHTLSGKDVPVAGGGSQ